MSTVATLSLPTFSSAIASTIGASLLHGPHHVAPKSTSTGWSDLTTSASTLPSFSWMTVLLVAMGIFLVSSLFVFCLRCLEGRAGVAGDLDPRTCKGAEARRSYSL